MSEGFNPVELSRRDVDRLRDYKELLDFYHGVHWEGRERRSEKRLTFNYAKVFIDKVTSYLMSGINFTVDPVEDSDEAKAKARKAEAALYQVYEDNNLEQLDFETAPSLATPVIRLSGTRRQEVSGLPPPIFRASMPGGWGMIPQGCGELPRSMTLAPMWQRTCIE